MYARYPNPEPIERSVRLVMSRQLPVSAFYNTMRLNDFS
jgi:hypothetical protein